jgi:hypothetical protein
MAAQQKHDVLLVSPTPLLDDFAADLAATITEPVGLDVELRIGIHFPVRLAENAPAGRRSLLVGLQTEHLLDATGKPMWRTRIQNKFMPSLARYDVVLDLSEANRPIYADLPTQILSRVHFGPHIYPAAAPALTMRPGGPLLFFGAPNHRRAEHISQLRAAGVAVQEVRKKTFGKALSAAMVTGSAVLNLHFDEGIYSEAPRILKAMLAGLPLVSEELAPPFRAGVHYLTLDHAADDAERLANTYANLTQMLGTGYSLAGFLRRVAQERSALA